DELDQGQYKRNDWDYFLIEKSQGVWLDHLTFEQAYDGIIDVKEESSNITLSWSKLDFTPNPFVVAQIDHLENNRENNPFYDGLRTDGMEIDDIVLYASFQKKGFNLGNTTDGEGFESITMTFHHLEITNLQDRMPRIRKGDVHVYHIILDNRDIDELRTKYNHISLSIINQGIVTTEAGSVLMEHSIFKYVSTPIKNHQDSNPDIRYTGRYKVVNSELVKINNTYFGSSDDPITIWRHHNDLEPLTFELRNHDEIPYVYQKRDVYFLAETFSEYPTGHQHIESFSWFYTNQTNN
ncbi:MAG: hypothetical protein IH571_00100, partial [Acholeplasmataceae bacterium]|nr:hypothetical protein [Acholeplasmataceae bacterium]